MSRVPVPTLTGIVTAYDDDAGLGTIRTADGSDYPVQCIAVADGSRHLDVGATVAFGVLARLGRLEAGAVGPLPSTAPRNRRGR